MTTLGQGDFEVRDEGKPQPIVVFDNTPQPVRLIAMLDVSGSMEGNLPILREGSNALFARLRPDDYARVGSFGRDVTISEEFTNDARVLAAALPDAIPPDAPDAAVEGARQGDWRLRPRARRPPRDPRPERRQGFG